MEVMGQKMFALLVGINKYRSEWIADLDGCVSDAKAYKAYLMEHLHVPEDNIRMLTDEAATREGILAALKAQFLDNSRIGEDDAMVFCYAGHGSQVAAPDGWITDDMMTETICPHDETTDEDDAPYTYGIPDRTLWGIFHQIAKAKNNNNITVILDCCHSGSGTRGGPKFRNHQHGLTPPPDIDRQLWDIGVSRGIHFKPKSGFRNMASHVLLAACRQDELARETHDAETNLPSGAFTHALLRTLSQLLSRKVTYQALMELLPRLQAQHPQCEGENKYCFLFSTNSNTDEKQFFAVKRLKSGKLQVEAGSVQGVTRGTEFQIYKERDSASEPLAVFYATTVRSMNSVLASHIDIVTTELPLPLYGLVTRWENPEATLLVYFDSQTLDTEQYDTLGQLFVGKQPGKAEYARVPSKEDADVVLHNAGGKIQIERVDQWIGRYANPMLKPIAQSTVHNVLVAAAHFKFHLNRANPEEPLKDKVKVELHKLKEVEGDPSAPYVVDSADLFESGQAVLQESDDQYGMTLRNSSEMDFFPCLFYFDPSDYSIEAWYLPPSTTMAAPLRSNQEFTLGYGNCNAEHMSFSLEEDEQSDTSFLKLFVSQQYAEMAHVEQVGVFDLTDDDDAPTLNKGSSSRGAHVWDTRILTITVTRDAPKIST